MATNKVFCSYDEIIDLKTEPDKVSAIGIHTPDTDTPHKMFSGFYDQFKKYKYLGCDVTLVPAARLPVDPLQVSYDNPNDAIDPRDILNPILFHGCHGQDLGQILNMMYSGALGTNNLTELIESDSADLVNFLKEGTVSGNVTFVNDILENLYYKALTDNTWRKSHPQAGFRKRGLHPMVYSVSTTHQIMPGVEDNYESISSLGDVKMPGLPAYTANFEDYSLQVSRSNTATPQLFSNRLRSLGWMDTRNVVTQMNSETGVTVGPSGEAGNIHYDLTSSIAGMLNSHSTRAIMPRLYMAVFLMPPAYQVQQHFRMILRHHYSFAGFRGISFQNDSLADAAPSVFNFSDPQEGE